MESRDEKIISLVKIKGPVVPSQISSEIGLDPMFASAMLSDLASKKRVLISHLKSGSSPLYYLPEQKQSLENYIKNLNHKEREAFLILKEKKVVEDSELEPAIRVAIRSIKDFAIPLKVTQNNQEKIFWRIYSITNEEAIPAVKEHLKRYPAVISAEKKIEDEKSVLEEADKKQIKKHEGKKKTSKEKEEFNKRIVSFADNSSIDIIAEINIKRKDETNMIISLGSSLGKLDYLLIAKNKESIANKDIIFAYKKGKRAKMPVLFLTGGELTIGAEKYAKSLKGHLIVRRLSP